MTKIDPSFYLQNQTQDRTTNPELGKDEFLKILMTQLQHQDPLDPMDDKDFISQMATFSSLEQMMQMASSIDTLVQSQMMSPVVQYSHMIGKEVSYEQFDEETDQKTGEETSIVVAVTQKDGLAVLKLENGEEIYADLVLQINDQNMNESSEDVIDDDVVEGEGSD